jgi:MFS family permease
MQSYPQYLRECLPLALRGSLQGALNWVAILIAALLGGFAQYLGAQLVFADGWPGVVLSAIISSVLLWLLIAVLRLFFVAPYQLWKLSYRPEYQKKLQEFYLTVTELLQRKLPADISEEEFESYVGETKQWASETARWIQDNISYPARVKFLDRTGVTPAQDPAQVNERHGKILANLQRFKVNLETLISTDDWQ